MTVWHPGKLGSCQPSSADAGAWGGQGEAGGRWNWAGGGLREGGHMGRLVQGEGMSVNPDIRPDLNPRLQPVWF